MPKSGMTWQWNFLLPGSGTHTFQWTGSNAFVDSQIVKMSRSTHPYYTYSFQGHEIRLERKPGTTASEPVKWKLLVDGRMVEEHKLSKEGNRDFKSAQEGSYQIATHFTPVCAPQAVYVFLVQGKSYNVTVATLVSVLGPTFALNGPQGSMHESVKAMKEERLNILGAFITGAVSFGLCQVFTVWIIAPIETSIPVTCLLGIGFFFIRRAMARIKRKFKYDEIYAGNDNGRGSTTASKTRTSSIYDNVFGAQPDSPTSRPMKAQAFLSQKRYPGTMLEKEPTPHSNSRGQINLNAIEYP